MNDTPKHAAQASAASSQGGRDYAVLIVEDDADIAKLTERIVKRTLTCETTLAGDGDTGLAELAKTPYDVVITDMRLPGTHGLELLEKIRSAHPNISIIVATGFTDVFPYVEAVATGADDFLSKPFQAAELQAKLLRVIRERDLRHASTLAEKKYRRLFESSSEGMALLDGQSLLITDANQACADLFDRERDALLGISFASLLRGEDGERFTQWLPLCNIRGKGTIGDLTAKTPTGCIIVLDISLTFIEVDTESIVFLTCKDVTERHEVHRRLADAAQRDKLTGLFNKDAFESRMAWAVSKAHQQESGLVLLLIDLDNFKHCNDTFGHQVGDQLLANVGGVIKSSIRTTISDVGFRCGGDEFSVILDGTNLQGALVVAERMLEEFRNSETYGTSMSIGLAGLAPGMTPAKLIKQADTALYKAKAEGKDTVRTAKP